MRRSTIVVAAGGVAVGLVLVVACGQDAVRPTAAGGGQVAAPRVAASRVGVAASRVGDASAGRESARARFHRTNRLDAVGVAHNAALRAYAQRVRKREVRGNLCDDILAFVGAGNYLPAGVHATAGELRSAATRVMSSNGACGTKGTSIVRGVTFQDAGSLSPSASALLSRMDAAIAGSASSEALAAALQPLTEAAASLSPAEADLVTASASVALSSEEYWEATLTDEYIETQTNGILATYGTCFTQFSYAEMAVLHCTGLAASHGELPVSFRRSTGPAASPFRLAAFVVCPKPSAKEIAHQDFVGAVVGGMSAIWTGAGVVPAAIGGAVGGSMAEALWQTAKGAWCYGSNAVHGVETT